jgi:hypothetical protein
MNVCGRTQIYEGISTPIGKIVRQVDSPIPLPLNEQDSLSVLDARLRFAFYRLAAGQKTS